MTLFDRMKSDNKRILSSEDEMHPLTLYDGRKGEAGTTIYSGHGQFTNPGMNFNPQGQPVASKKSTIGFHIDSFEPVIPDKENFKNWEAEFLNSNGETVLGRFTNPLVDKTFGYVRIALTDIKTQS